MSLAAGSADPYHDPTFGVGTGRVSKLTEDAGRFIVRRYRAVFWTCLVFPMLLGAVAFTAVPFSLHTPILSPLNTQINRNQDAFDAAARFIAVDADVVQPQQSLPFGAITLIYGRADGDVDVPLLTQSNAADVLAPIRQLELDLLQRDGYDHHCLINPALDPGSCAMHFSALNLMYGSFGANATLIPSNAPGDVTLIPDPLATMASDQMLPGVATFFSKEFKSCNLEARFLRSIFLFGGPLADHNNLNDDLSAQTASRDGFAARLRDWLDAQNGDESNAGGFTVYYAGDGISDDEIGDFILLDALFPIGSVTLVVLYMYYHMRSWTLAAMGMINILLAFPSAYFVFRVVLQQPMNNLNFMSVFLTLGIGADDVFIIIDTWRQSPYTQYEPSLVWTFTRSVKTMFVTSFTTTTSFLASGFSDIPAIQNFGLFAALNVITNFLLVCTFFFSVMCRHDLVLRSAMVSAAKKDDRSSYHHDATTMTAWTVGQSDAVRALARYGIVSDGKDTQITVPNSMVPRRTSVWLGSVYVPWLHRHRWRVLAAWLAVLVVAGVFAGQLQAEQTPQRFLPEWSNLEQFVAINTRYFNADEHSLSVDVSMVWGIDDIDRSARASPDDPDDRGEVVFDEAFSLFPNQQRYIDVCESGASLSAWVVPGSDRCVLRALRDALHAAGDVFPVNTTEADLALKLRALAAAQPEFIDHVGFDDFSSPTRVRWISLTFTSTLPAGQVANTIRPHFEHWDSFTADANAASATSFQAFHTSGAWVDMAGDETLAVTAQLGMLTSGAIAFVILLATNRNVRLTVFAMTSIAAVVVSLMACMVAFGFELGAPESIILTTTIGLAVDYVVHLAEAYKISIKPTRLLRTIEAQQHIGASIIGGAVTTLLSASLLFVAFIRFSMAIGQMIFFTIVLSLVFSMGFFTTLLLVFGPENRRRRATAAPSSTTASSATLIAEPQPPGLYSVPASTRQSLADIDVSVPAAADAKPGATLSGIVVGSDRGDGIGADSLGHGSTGRRSTGSVTRGSTGRRSTGSVTRGSTGRRSSGSSGTGLARPTAVDSIDADHEPIDAPADAE